MVLEGPIELLMRPDAHKMTSSCRKDPVSQIIEDRVFHTVRMWSNSSWHIFVLPYCFFRIFLTFPMIFGVFLIVSNKWWVKPPNRSEQWSTGVSDIMHLSIHKVMLFLGISYLRDNRNQDHSIIESYMHCLSQLRSNSLQLLPGPLTKLLT